MNITPLHNHVIFEFTDNVNSRSLVSKLDSGIILSNDAEITDQNTPRWAEVVSIGDDVIDEGILVGDYILVAPLMWTTAVEVDGKKLWKTDESHIMCTSTERHTRF